LTGHRVRDSTRVTMLLEQTSRPLESICADGAYDRQEVYQAA
ncbi:MAG TPA: IS5/IS1182 family transposase, partial [Candidatus Latescibacteria bacterium]|nr:IS5/IS1182 family transposase [Candidatus Latescibacterota bacterium]